MKSELVKIKMSPFFSNLISAIIAFGTGFIVSSASFPLSVHPAGVALASFVPRKIKHFSFFNNISFHYLYVGIITATFTYKANGIMHFTMYCALFMIRLAMTGGKFNETRNIKIILSVISSLCIGFVSGAVNGFNVWSTLAIIILSTCSPGFTYLFEKIASEKTTSYEIGCGAFIFALLYGIKSFRIFTFSVSLIISGTLTLVCAKKKGPLYGALMGLVCGMAGENFLFPPILGIMGFSSGIFFTHSDLFSVLLGYITSLSYGIYCSGFDAIALIAPELLASCAAFFPIKHFIPVSHSSPSIPVSAAAQKTEHQQSLRRLTDISDAFSELSRLSLKSEEIRTPDLAECDYYVKRAFEEICGECVMKHVCEISDEKESLPLRKIISRALCERKLAVGAMPEVANGKCCNTDKIAAVSLRNYRRALTHTSFPSKTRALSGEYNTVSKVLKNAAKSENLSSSPSLPEAFRIKRALENLDINYKKLEVSGNRKAIIKVFGISTDKIRHSSERIRTEIEKECGFAVASPEFYTENSEEIMQVIRCPKISLEYAKASLTKNGENTNGDKISVFETSEDFFYSLICDGMGSGGDAAQVSSLASAFIEKLIRSNLERDITIEILNNYLISKDAECFSTIDLLEIDKVSAEASFIKAGAAPAFIIRCGKLHKIASCTPPAGVLYNMTAEKTAMKLQKDDVVVMMSDGIMENSDMAPWLMELFTYSLEGSASEMTEKILSAACDTHGRRDDMSVAVIKIL